MTKQRTVDAVKYPAIMEARIWGHMARHGRSYELIQCACGYRFHVFVWSWAGHGYCFCPQCNRKYPYSERGKL